MSIVGFVTFLFWIATATLAVGLARRGSDQGQTRGNMSQAIGPSTARSGAVT